MSITYWSAKSGQHGPFEDVFLVWISLTKSYLQIPLCYHYVRSFQRIEVRLWWRHWCLLLLPKMENGMSLDHMPKMPKKEVSSPKTAHHQWTTETTLPSKIPRCKYVGIHASCFGVWWGFFVILIIIIIVIIITVSLFYRYDYVQSIVVGTSYKS